MNKIEIINYLKSKIPDYSSTVTANTHLFHWARKPDCRFNRTSC
jgi:hypothetical protein